MATMPQYDLALLVGKEARAEHVRVLLTEARDFLQSLDAGDFTWRNLDRGFHNIAATHATAPAHLSRPLRVAIQGNIGWPGLYETMRALGKERTLKLLDTALRALSDIART